MKVVVLTTSYPRDENEVAGSFVAAAVEGVRAQGVDVAVVSPASFTDFGIAYRSGVAQNLRSAPWKLAFVPAFMAGYARAARRAARDADLVHAHWIPSALAARATGKPYVLQVWGTDVEVARRMPALVRPLVRGARLVIAASSFLADEARALGAREVRIVPPGVMVPMNVGAPSEPPHALFVGRLSEEKGILEFLEATEGLPRVIVGDGPLRDRVPEAVGFVPPSEVGAYYERAAVVCVPSRREGYGMTAREALAYGRPVVATRVGGLADLTAGVVLVAPGDTAALRRELKSLLDDAGLRRRSGEEALDLTRREFSLEASASALVAAYTAAVTAPVPTHKPKAA
jgi:glycosyltransferase involved in cell wall biosynthesis